jgi:LysR family transcriptional activator of dmlA
MENHLRIESLNELRTYVAIIGAGSLAGAAATLGVTPNAVSRRLGLLEGRLGRRLIHRTTRRLAVTDEGQRFHARCRRALDELDEAEREIAGADGLSGTLRVAIHSEMVCPDLLIALRELLESSSQLRVQVRVERHFVEPIGAGLDLAVHAGRPPASSLVSIPLGSMTWGLAAAPVYLARHGRPTRPEQLVDHACVRMLSTPPETHWHLRPGGGRSKRFVVGGRFEVTDARALVEAMHAGMGIGIRLRSAIDSAAREGTLEHVLPQWQWASTPFFALLPRGRAKLPGVRAMLEVLRRATQSLVV